MLGVLVATEREALFDYGLAPLPKHLYWAEGGGCSQEQYRTVPEEVGTPPLPPGTFLVNGPLISPATIAARSSAQQWWQS